MELRLVKAVAGLALWMGAAFGLQAQTVVEYIHTDALGTPVAITNAAGMVIERSVYEPNGQLINRPLTDGPGFTGHVQDAATGLTYMQQRYYDPMIGRFLSVDPVTASSGTGANFNRYWYANNNPYKFMDPDGRAPCRNDNFNCDRMGDPISRQRQRECEMTCLGDTAKPIGESKPHSRGSAIRANFRDNIDNSILGPGGKDAVHFLGDEIVDGMGNLADGNLAPAAKSMAVGLVFKKLGPLSGRITSLYQKLDSSGRHLKFGIAVNPATRYTIAELNGGRLNIIATGARSDMLKLERNLHETLPIGPEERQFFYIQKQLEKGLNSPPYTP